MPPGWEWATLAELCEINPKHSGQYDDALPVSFVPMAAVDEQSGQITGAVERSYGEIRKGYTHFANDDVLWAKITPCMENGKSAVASGLTNGLGCGTTEFFVLRSRGAVLPQFLHLFMRRKIYRESARKTMQSGVGQARVPKEFIENTKLPVPPLAEQRRIVEKLEELLAGSRAARAALDAIPTMMEQYRQTVLVAAFTGELTKAWREGHSGVEDSRAILKSLRDAQERARRNGVTTGNRRRGPDPWDSTPEHHGGRELPMLPSTWSWATWGQLSEWITYGFTRPMPHVDGGPLIVTGKNVGDGVLALEGAHHTTVDAFEGLSDKDRPEPGDILVTKDGSIGRAAVVPECEPFCINQSVAVVYLRACNFDRRFLLRMIQSPFTQTRIKEQTRGMAIPHLSITDFARMPVPIAPLEEQRAIADAIDRLDTTLLSVAGTLGAISTMVAQLEQAVLAKAFNGELVPQSATEEPASSVLARIRGAGVEVSAPRSRRRVPSP